MILCKFWSTYLPLPKSSHFLIIIFFFLVNIRYATPLSFSFPSFYANDPNITYFPDAYLFEGTIELTKNQRETAMNQSMGRATYHDLMHLWDKASGQLTDFTTNFSFTIKADLGNDKHGDGITFFLAPEDFPMPNAKEGKGLGLISGKQTNATLPSEIIYPFLAVEFDTFKNEFDPPGNHVGIDIHSMISVQTVPWCINITDGKRNQAWIGYNSSSKNLSVTFTGFCYNQEIQESLSYEVDLRDYLPEWVRIGFSAATGDYYERHAVHSWNFSSSLQVEEKFPNYTPPPLAAPPSPNNPKSRQNRKKTGLNVGLISVGVCVSVIVALGLIWLILRMRKKRDIRGEEDNNLVLDASMEEEFEGATGPKKFSFDELACATSNFVEDEKLGEGGFGGVYRGFLRDLNCYVAVKRVSRGSKQGKKEYASEVKIISRLRHRNLVKLLGWCHEKTELLLVYEFMPNGSLDAHLFKEKSLLTWSFRYKIAQGLASAVQYLHKGYEQCVVHRDIKSSNLMLDSCFNARLGDFGLARFVDHERGSQTTVLAGTMGYMAPECTTTGNASKESDVYSFGIVALEIACGRKPINHNSEESQVVLVKWVWELYGKGALLEAADPRLSRDFDKKQMERLMIVGLWCAHPDCDVRPSIEQANNVLNFVDALPVLPSKMPVATYLVPPAQMYVSSGNTCGRNSSQCSSSSQTISLLVPR